VLFESVFANLHHDTPTKVDFGNDSRAPTLVQMAFTNNGDIPHSLDGRCSSVHAGAV
jgi:hypothetical protein